jgi:hypothetical protein
MKFIIQAGKERLESNGGLVLGGKILSGLNLGPASKWDHY